VGVEELAEEVGLDGLDFEEPLTVVVEEVVEFFVEVADFEFGFEVDAVVLFGAVAVAGFLAALAHHDDWSLEGGDAGEEEVEEDVGVGVWRVGAPDGGIEEDPEGEEGAEGEDERPAAAEGGEVVGEAFTESAGGEGGGVFGGFGDDLVFFETADDGAFEVGDFADFVGEGFFDVGGFEVREGVVGDDGGLGDGWKAFLDEAEEGGAEAAAWDGLVRGEGAAGDGAGERGGRVHGGECGGG
jgi:hypothetical protein